MAKAIGIVENGVISPFSTIQALLDVSLNFAFFKKAKSKMPAASGVKGILDLFSGH